MRSQEGIWITARSLASDLQRLHRLDDGLHARGVRPGLDAVAEVEDVTGRGGARLGDLDGTGDGDLGRAEEDGRVVVSLHGDVRDARPDLLDGRAPVDGDHVEPERRHLLHVTGGPGGEEDGRDARLPDRRGDLREVGEAELLEVLATELAEPALEDLRGVRARRDLLLDLDDGRLGELLEEGVGRLRLGVEHRLEPGEALAPALDGVARDGERTA